MKRLTLRFKLLRETNPSNCKLMFPENILKDKSKYSNPTKPRKVGREPDNLFPLKFKSLSPSILPQASMNSFGIEGSRLLERSRLSKVSIWQSRGRKSEDLRENPDSDILVMKEFPELQLTPFHEHGSMVIFHKRGLSMSLETLDMMLVWVEDS